MMLPAFASWTPRQTIWLLNYSLQKKINRDGEVEKSPQLIALLHKMQRSHLRDLYPILVDCSWTESGFPGELEILQYAALECKAENNFQVFLLNSALRIIQLPVDNYTRSWLGQWNGCSRKNVIACRSEVSKLFVLSQTFLSPAGHRARVLPPQLRNTTS